jgi:lysozyme family protein
MATPTYRSLWPIYAKQWDRMAVKPDKAATVAAIAKRILANKSRYQKIEKSTGVPWFMVGALHERESSQNWNTQLAQGDPLNAVSIHVPKGRGPFKTFEESAYDALVNLKGYDKVVDWRLEKILYYCEKYNGWGYWQYHSDVPSPYIWSMTNVQKPGKYVRDGVWDPSEIDKQVGCAILISALADLDKTIKLVRETEEDEPAPPTPDPVLPDDPVEKMLDEINDAIRAIVKKYVKEN